MSEETCRNCGQPLLAGDASCWQCGQPVAAPDATAAIAPADIAASRFNPLNVYRAGAVAVILLVLLTAFALGRRPLVQQVSWSGGDGLVNYVAAGERFTVAVPPAWPVAERGATAGFDGVAAAVTPWQSTLAPWAMSAGDLELLFVAAPTGWTDGPPPAQWLFVARSAALAGLDTETAVTLAERADSVAQVEAVADFALSHIAVTLRPTSNDAVARCRQRLYLSQPQAYLLVVCQTDAADDDSVYRMADTFQVLAP